MTNIKENTIGQNMKVILYDGRYRIVEKETMEYPARKYPAYFASPIYQDDDGRFEMRRAGANWISSNDATIITDLPESRIEEIKQSIINFLDFCKRMMKQYYVGSDEEKIFTPMVE